MDVKYRPEPWQNMGDGMNRITKDALMKLREANESLKRIDGRIRDLDSDGSIHFSPKDQSQKIGNYLIAIRHYKNIAEKQGDWCLNI